MNMVALVGVGVLRYRHSLIVSLGLQLSVVTINELQS
jgi:hypothetical protein